MLSIGNRVRCSNFINHVAFGLKLNTPWGTTLTSGLRARATKSLTGAGPISCSRCVPLVCAVLCFGALVPSSAPAGSAAASGRKDVTLGYHLTLTTKGLMVATGVPSTNPELFNWRFAPADVRVASTIAGANAWAEPMVTPMRGHRITAADLFKLASRLEAEAKRHGLLFSRAVVPGQLLRDGARVTVGLVDVRVASISSEGLPSTMVERLRQRGQGLIGAREPRGRAVADLAGWAQYEFGQEMSVQAGETGRADRVDLLASGPVHPIVSEVTTSAFLAKPFQVSTVGLASTGYDLLGQHERILVGGTYAREHDTPATNGPLWSVSAAAAVPFDALGVFLEPSVAGARVRLGDGASSELYGVTKGALFVGAPAALDGDAAVVLRAGLEATSEQLAFSFASPGGSIALRLPLETVDARWAASWSKRLENGIALEAGFDAGIGATSGGGDSALVHLRNGTWPIGRAELRGKIDVPVAFDATVTLGGRIAASFLGPLPPSLQVQLLQAIGAAPIDPRTIQGDSGGFLRAEFARTFRGTAFERAASLQPYVFGSAGVLYARESAFAYPSRVTGFSSGLGVRLAFALPRRDVPLVEIALEGARQETTSADVPNFSSVTLASRVRF